MYSELLYSVAFIITSATLFFIKVIHPVNTDL